jgi:dinuclear metal center YbgI/SA1388 family protein
MVKLKTIVDFLDTELKIKYFEDASHNGLQVANFGNIKKICVGVDASLEFFTLAAKEKANLLICHHGLSWKDSLKRITGMNYNRLKFLIQNDIALYAAHLPLDAHPELGNNIQICKKLGLKNIKQFGNYNNMLLGFTGSLPTPLNLKEFKQLVSSSVGKIVGTMDFGKKKISSVAVVSGGAASNILEAAELGIDVFLTGEPELTAYHIAQECRINAVFAGHYSTEVFGVKAVARLLEEKFLIKAEFIDTKTPF